MTCLFVGWTAATQTARIAPFETLFSGLGVSLPLMTRVALATSHEPFPLLAGAIVIALLLGKEVLVKNKWSSTCINLCAFVLVDGASRFADTAMGMPMIDIVSKIK
jgi:hypothetical protein